MDENEGCCVAGKEDDSIIVASTGKTKGFFYRHGTQTCDELKGWCG
jgi:hypothetical protein